MAGISGKCSERYPTGKSKKRRWFSYKSSYNLRSGPERNIDKKVQLFRGSLAFSSTMEVVCTAKVQAQYVYSNSDDANKHFAVKDSYKEMIHDQTKNHAENGSSRLDQHRESEDPVR